MANIRPLFARSLSSTFRMSKAAACIIANEVLNGKTLDTNSHYLAQIKIIPDEVDVIVKTIRDLSAEYGIVFTSGGIGPTHDDLTYESIAKAFDRPLRLHKETEDRMRTMMKIDKLNEGQVRMAVLPSPDRVLYTPGLWVPLAQVNNVLIFPGVPRLFHQMIDHWFDSHLSSSGLLTIPRIRRLVKTFEKESVLAGRLAGFQDQGKQLGIEIGSYPKLLKDGQTFVVLSIIGPKAQEDKVEQLAGRIIMEFNGTSYDLEQDE